MPWAGRGKRRKEIMKSGYMGIPDLPIFDIKRAPFSDPIMMSQPDHVWNALWDAYYDGVTRKGLHFYSSEFPVSTWSPIFNYMLVQTDLQKHLVAGFLNALESWSTSVNDTKYINPLRHEAETAEFRQAIKNVFTAPSKVAAETIKNISEPLTKPLIWVGIIALVSAAGYGYYQYKKVRPK